MLGRIALRLALPMLIAAAVLPLAARAHSQDSQTQSVAEAARRSRAQKKASSKPEQVITNDTLKPAFPAATSNSPASPPSTEAAPDASKSQAPDNASAPASGNAPVPKSADVEEKAKATAELADLKQQLADAQKDVDLLRREFALAQDSIYSNPNYTDDATGKAKLDALNQQITDKQQSIDALKTRIAALQDSLGTKAPATPAAPSSAPQPCYSGATVAIRVSSIPGAFLGVRF